MVFIWLLNMIYEQNLVTLRDMTILIAELKAAKWENEKIKAEGVEGVFPPGEMVCF